MAEKGHDEGFFSTNRRLLKEWLEAKLEVYKLKLVRITALAAGHTIWIMVLLFLVFLLATFIGLTAGFWLGQLTGSYAKGFGLVTLAIVLLIVLLALFRKQLFVNPFIRSIIGKMNNGEHKKEETEEKH